MLEKPNIFVETPALRAASDPEGQKCFFVGRRGTGKTAIALYLERLRKNTQLILPQLFAPLEKFFAMDEMLDVHQRPFKTLVTSFKRALLAELILSWRQRGLVSLDRLRGTLSRERNYLEDYDFDLRMLAYTEEGFEALANDQDRDWLRSINRVKEIAADVEACPDRSGYETILIVDRIDESWDGTDKAVVLLMALMHACVELNTSVEICRAIVFLRENVFERVRVIDREFARLETFVASLDWSRELLVEMIERRLNSSLITKFALRGETWNAFFEQSSGGEASQNLVFNYCQFRPRDVLTYCSFALESAQARRHEQIMIEDLYAARRRFSDSRLKDLGDEYADNYPQLQLVIGRFYGLGQEYTLSAIGDFVKKLLVDEDVKRYCRTWIYRHTQPDLFIRLLYDIGFVGLRPPNSTVQFRSAGPQSPTPPAITDKTTVVIHPTYQSALDLQNFLVTSLNEEMELKEAGIISTVPGAIDFDTYNRELRRLQEELKTLPLGDPGAAKFEELVGDIIKFCFYTCLTNVEPRVRDLSGRVVRDWIAGNHATEGFWAMIRSKYGATQVVWECKNYKELHADDFHQASYYMNDAIGRFVLVAFRGHERKASYLEHVRRISNDKKGLVLLLEERDLFVFLRQALNGKSSQNHLQDLYDQTVRLIS